MAEALKCWWFQNEDVTSSYTLLLHKPTVAVALYPGLLTPVFVTCSTNAGEGLVKLSRGMTYLDVWRSGTFLLYSCKAAFWIQESRQDCLMTSAQLFYGPCLQSVVHSLTCCFCGNVPLLHTSRYVIPRDSVLPGLPCVSTASNKRWGEKAWVRGYCSWVYRSRVWISGVTVHT